MEEPDRFQDVLSAATSGAEWALEELFRELYPRLLRYLRATEPSEAEDIASDVWIEVATGLVRFQGGETALRAWAFTIARRRVIDLRRRRGRRATEPMEPGRVEELSSSGNVEEDAMTSLTTQAALTLIATLPSDQAEVILLRVLGGHSVAEVAAIMNKRPGTVRVLQHRGLRRLARRIVKEGVTG